MYDINTGVVQVIASLVLVFVGSARGMAVTCAVCYGNPAFCEKHYSSVTCAPPNNFCINTVDNANTGRRIVNRKCGNYQTCYQDWYLGSSDNDLCRIYDAHFVLTLQFSCTYCCTGDMCNVPLKPDDSKLFNPNARR